MSHLSNVDDEKEWFNDTSLKKLEAIKEQLKGMDKKTPELKDSSIEDKITFLLWVNDNGIIDQGVLK